MNERILHIVAFDVPFPPDYGGVVDIFYKLEKLHALGVRIILHCQYYGRTKSEKLNEFCEKVHFYPRKRHFKYLLTRRPFIVESRISKELVERLKTDNHPILVEGIHNAWLLENVELRPRISIRTHNVEHRYYEHLARRAHGFSKVYFKSEARKLERYEKILRFAKHIFPLSEADCNYFRRINPATSLLPVFFGTFRNDEELEQKPGNYILYHGNLSVTENSEAVRWLNREVFAHLDETSVIVAGKAPDQELRAELEKNGVQLIADPDEEHMSALIAHAAAHVLYSDQDTGIKLKLLHALRTNAPVIVNDVLVRGNDLAELCRVARSAEEFRRYIQSTEPLSGNERERREYFLETHYNRADLLVAVLFPG